MFRKQVELQWTIGEDSWPRDLAWQSDPPWPHEASWRTNVTAFRQSDSLIPPDTATAERALIAWLARGVVLFLVIIVVAAGAPHDLTYHHYLETKAAIQAVVERESGALRRDDRELYSQLVENRSTIIETSSWLDPWRLKPKDRRSFGLDLIDIQLLSRLAPDDSIHNTTLDITQQGATATREPQSAPNELVLAIVRLTPPETHWVPVPYAETRFYRPSAAGWLRTPPPFGYWGTRQIVETRYANLEYYPTDAATVARVAATLDDLYVDIVSLLDRTPTPNRQLNIAVELRAANGLASAGYRQTVTSPSLYRIPATATPDEHLTFMIAGHFTNRALAEALAVSELFNMNSWYNASMGVRGWMLGQVLGQPPYWHAPAKRQLQRIRQHTPTLALADITTRGQIDPDLRLVRQFTAETAIAYGLETYGAERLPLLVRGFTQHQGWDALIPGVFGVELAAYEAGWNAYLDAALARD